MNFYILIDRGKGNGQKYMKEKARDFIAENEKGRHKVKGNLYLTERKITREREMVR